MKLRHILTTIAMVAFLLGVTCIATAEQSTISASPIEATPGDEITVIYSGAPGFDTDWIAIYRTDAAARDRYGEWYYLRGKKSGTLTFTAPQEVGEYEFRMFENFGGGGGYNDIARSNIVSVGPMGPQSTISASPIEATPGDEITAIYSGAPGFDTDWIAIYRTGAANERYGEWYYLRGERNGTLTFTAPREAGEYEFRMFGNFGGGGGYNDIARSNIVSVGPMGPQSTISASPIEATPGDEITAIYSGAPGFDTDWIAIYRTGAANERYGEWYYLRGERNGTLIFTAPREAGEYEFRMFGNWGGGGGYNDIARSNIVSVGPMGPQSTISASPIEATPGDEITVIYSGAPGFDTDWIAIYRTDAAARDRYGEWYYLRGERNGTLTFTAPQEIGEYEFRMFGNFGGGGGYNDIARSNIVSVGPMGT